MNCAFSDCAKPAEKRGWCGTHYARWRVHGDPAITKKRANGAGYLQGGYAGHQVNGVRKFDHVTIAERALGHPLPAEAVVHHADGGRSDNSNQNLVICPNRAYHNLLHARLDAFKACGNPDSRKCRYCRKYDTTENLRLYSGSKSYFHQECRKQASLEKIPC